jgi:uncharacterized damage-inducible protein DinB
MLDLLRALIAHKGHADARMLNAIRRNATAVTDPDVLQLLHHVLVSNRFWLHLVLGHRFVLSDESRTAASFGELIERYRDTHSQETEWLANAAERDLSGQRESALMPGGACSVSQALMQVCLHSHGHRAQCAKLLRGHGTSPPPTDFILWLTTRPEPDWMEEA